MSYMKSLKNKIMQKKTKINEVKTKQNKNPFLLDSFLHLSGSPVW